MGIELGSNLSRNDKWKVTTAGTVDEESFQTKSGELKAEATSVAGELDGLGEVAPQHGKVAQANFERNQPAAETWLGSNTADRRQILDAVCLNRASDRRNSSHHKEKALRRFRRRARFYN